MAEVCANSAAASDLGMHCLPNTLVGVSRLQWVNVPTWHKTFFLYAHCVQPITFDTLLLW